MRGTKKLVLAANDAGASTALRDIRNTRLRAVLLCAC
jgi:hypothetical protein